MPLCLSVRVNEHKGHCEDQAAQQPSSVHADQRYMRGMRSVCEWSSKLHDMLAQVLRRLPKLKKLDGQAIDPEEREAAAAKKA